MSNTSLIKESISKKDLTKLVKSVSIKENQDGKQFETKLDKVSNELLESFKKLWDPKYVNEVMYKMSGKDPNKVAALAKTTKPEDTIEVTDEVVNKEPKNNPWSICTSSVGKKDKKKFERCIKDVKKQQKLDEDLKNLEEYMGRIIVDEDKNQNPKMKKGSFVQFVSKLK